VVGHRLEGAACALAAEATWFGTGDLDGAERLAARAIATLVDAPIDLTWAMIHEAAGDVHLLRGRTEEAASMHRLAAQHLPWAYEGRALAALALAYSGDPSAARLELDEARRHASYPTLRGFGRYVDAEIDGLEEDWESAEAGYREAIAVAGATGASFLVGVAEVGLVSALVATGRARDALTGYEALIGRWERSGSWVQQWTTLRNLAGVLDATGQSDAAGRLRAFAADPPGPDRPQERDAALATARAAIAEALASG
jgi:tetratricopeptide (TPR) repeat protein